MCRAVGENFLLDFGFPKASTIFFRLWMEAALESLSIETFQRTEHKSDKVNSRMCNNTFRTEFGKMEEFFPNSHKASIM